MSRLHPETIADVRRRMPHLDDLPDEAVASLFMAQTTSLRLYARDLGRAYKRGAVRAVITFGDVMTAFDAPARERWRGFWGRRGY